MRPHNITVFQVDASTSDHEDEAVEQFSEQIDSTTAKSPMKDMLLAQGDWNATVGLGTQQQWAGTGGSLGIGETNDRGWRFIEFAKSNRLILTNTLYPNKLSWTATWHAPIGQVHNQIYFILTPQRLKFNVSKTNARSIPGADIGSDYDLVPTAIKLKLITEHFTKCRRI